MHGLKGAFNRRYATGIRRDREPWVETHGYHYEVASPTMSPKSGSAVPRASVNF